jgi:predicted metal-binding protein
MGAGADLLLKIKRALAAYPGKNRVRIEAQRCLMACTEGCVASISAEGKMQYLVARLRAEDKLVEQLLDFVFLYDAAPTGVTPNHEWPPLMAMHFLGRIPPANPVEADWRDDGCNL